MRDWEHLQKYVERITGGWQPPGSGSGVIKGDVLTRELYIECKAYQYKDASTYKPKSEWFYEAEHNADFVGKVPVLYYRICHEDGRFEDFCYCRSEDVNLFGIEAFGVASWMQFDPELLQDFCLEKEPEAKKSGRIVSGKRSWPKRSIARKK